MHLHILVSGVSNGSHIGLYGNLQISEYSYDGTSNTQTHGFSELHVEDYFLQGGKFSFNRWWIGKISDAEEGKIAMSCKPILDHERVIWLETFFYSTTLHANSVVGGLEGGGD